jgi:prepilin-type N-terminal cleavage/methylation domain-containing protein
MSTKRPTARRGSEAGLTLLELMVVVGIIGVLVAVALPNLRGYLRTQTIRSAANDVASELQAARLRAISKNVHLGVVFVILSNNTYQTVTEDDQDRSTYVGSRQAMSVLLADPAQVGQLRTLPQGVVFATASPNNKGIRFNSLGAACTPTPSVGACPDLDAPSGNFLSATGDFKITLHQASTDLYKSLFVTPGGRIVVDPGYVP